jgi:hypothetical protein
MTTLAEWSTKWNIPQEAIDELVQEIKHDSPFKLPKPHGQPADNEMYIQRAVRIEASEKGCILLRNNSGAFKDEKGRLVRFGLGNESAKINAVCKSPDLIGIRPVTILPEHVGRVFGVFLAREIKHGQWKYKGTKREQAQKNCIEKIIGFGGDAGFCIGPGTIL